MLNHFLIVYGCLCTIITEVWSVEQNCVGLKVENSYYLSLAEKFVPQPFFVPLPSSQRVYSCWRIHCLKAGYRIPSFLPSLGFSIKMLIMVCSLFMTAVINLDCLSPNLERKG
jgi:hypothetical protein